MEEKKRSQLEGDAVLLLGKGKRGVDVKIIVPAVPDKKTVFAVTRSYYRELL